nr:FeoA family protein [Tepidibacter aestuarii]
MNEACKFEGTSDCSIKNLSEAEVDVEYTIKAIETDDEEMKSFLFTLGCYEGEKVTVISVLAENYVISVKDARYSIDLELAQAISV